MPWDAMSEPFYLPNESDSICNFILFFCTNSNFLLYNAIWTCY